MLSSQNSRISINANIRESNFAVTSYIGIGQAYQQFDSRGNFIHYSQDYSAGAIEIILNSTSGGNSGQRCILFPGESFMGEYESFSVGAFSNCAAGVLHYGSDFTLSRIDISARRLPPFNSLSDADVPLLIGTNQQPRPTPRNVFCGRYQPNGAILANDTASMNVSVGSLITPSRTGGFSTTRSAVKAIIIKNSSLTLGAQGQFAESGNNISGVFFAKMFTTQFINPDGFINTTTIGYQNTAYDLATQNVTFFPSNLSITKFIGVATYKSLGDIILMPNPNLNFANFYNAGQAYFTLATGGPLSTGFSFTSATASMQGDLINIL